MGRRRGAGAVQLAGQGVVQDLVDQRTLAGAADAGDGDERAEREGDVDVLEVVLPGALDDRASEPRRRRRSPAIAFGVACSASRVRGMRRLVGTGIAFLPDRYCPVSDAFARMHLLRRALGGDLAAAVAGAGAEVEQVVGGGDHLAVVLDQDQRVAQVAQVLQRLQQPAVVARVQADGRLVEHVEHAGQAAADLAGQADALRLAAGQRRRRPAQRQVIQADIDQELQPVARSRAAVRRPPAAAPCVSLQVLEQRQRLAERQVAQLAERQGGRSRRSEAAGRGIVAQPGAAAGRSRAPR